MITTVDLLDEDPTPGAPLPVLKAAIELLITGPARMSLHHAEMAEVLPATRTLNLGGGEVQESVRAGLRGAYSDVRVAHALSPKLVSFESALDLFRHQAK